MKPLILMDFKSKRLFCVLRPLVQLHSRLDKAAKSMRKEDAPYVKLVKGKFGQSCNFAFLGILPYQGSFPSSK